MYWDDKYGTHTVSYEVRRKKNKSGTYFFHKLYSRMKDKNTFYQVIACMKKHMAEESKKSSGSSFLLDDDSRYTFLSMERNKETKSLQCFAKKPKFPLIDS